MKSASEILPEVIDEIERNCRRNGYLTEKAKRQFDELRKSLKENRDAQNISTTHR